MIFPFNAGEVFKIALHIEENGHLFYTQAAAKPFSDNIRGIFTELGDEELAHKALFEKFLNALPPETKKATVWDPTNELDQYLKMMADEHVFMQKPEIIAEKLKTLNTEAEALRMAMGFERDTIVFFLELMSVCDSQESQNEIKKLVDEERKHLKRLTEILHKVTAA
ncbi:MAG: ferritin-like domain-containing protein [Candidatus Adiutrix sp.]